MLTDGTGRPLLITVHTAIITKCYSRTRKECQNENTLVAGVEQITVQLQGKKNIPGQSIT